MQISAVINYKKNKIKPNIKHLSWHTVGAQKLWIPLQIRVWHSPHSFHDTDELKFHGEYMEIFSRGNVEILLCFGVWELFWTEYVRCPPTSLLRINFDTQGHPGTQSTSFPFIYLYSQEKVLFTGAWGKVQIPVATRLLSRLGVEGDGKLRAAFGAFFSCTCTCLSLAPVPSWGSLLNWASDLRRFRMHRLFTLCITQASI